jgi:hypothetical protein
MLSAGQQCQVNIAAGLLDGSHHLQVSRGGRALVVLVVERPNWDVYQSRCS